MTLSTQILLEHANKQQRLCDYSPLVAEFEGLDDYTAFQKDGYVLIPGICSPEQALITSYRIIKSLENGKVFYSDYVNTVQLSKADQIPVCESFIGTGFQALHFDYGLPLLEMEDGEQGAFDMVVALYYPYESGELSKAQTRVVSLQEIPKLKGISKESTDARIQNYVKRFGDGWTFPERYNSRRLSIFARVIDACLATGKFSEKIEEHSQNFFMPSAALDESELAKQQIAEETEYFASAGIDLKKIEKSFCLQPGQLLLIDNTRCVHGRIGNRKAKEVWQFLFGFKEMPIDLIGKTRKYLAGCLGK
ncbi:MAG TPA: hypothetical protein VEA58_00665 [Anaerovoracaceae bacterium]|nr:hypothetical protein [Anaerovoracaceae bacterium]